MKCQRDIEALAQEKLRDAQCLFDNRRYDGAYYLAGYGVELLLKAKVCKTLGIEDFFDFDNPAKTKLIAKNVDNIYKLYKVHDPAQLLVLSGIYSDFQKEISLNPNLLKHWSIVSRWDENSRYLTGKNNKDVQNFIISVREIMQWIQKHL